MVMKGISRGLWEAYFDIEFEEACYDMCIRILANFVAVL